MHGTVVDVIAVIKHQQSQSDIASVDLTGCPLGLSLGKVGSVSKDIGDPREIIDLC